MLAARHFHICVAQLALALPAYLLVGVAGIRTEDALDAISGLVAEHVGEASQAPAEARADLLTFKVLQFNVLGDGNAHEGFLVPREQDTAATFFARVQRTATLASEARKLAGGEKLTPELVLEAAAQNRGPDGVGHVIDESEVKLERENVERLIEWPQRAQAIVNWVVNSGADIVTFQLLDKYTDLASRLRDVGFTSVAKDMSPTKYADEGLQDRRLKVLDNPELASSAAYEDQLQALAAAGIAFAPGLLTSTRRIARRRGAEGTAQPDDEGVAIFWKTASFKAKSNPEMTMIGRDQTGDKAALKVVLTHVNSGKQVVVVTSHLSGHADKEIRRHWELQDIQDAFIEHERRPLLLTLDMNSQIWFDEFTQPDIAKSALRLAIKTTCFDLITGEGRVDEGKPRDPHGRLFTLTKWNLESVWGLDEKTKAGKAAPITVFKMRGPATENVNRIGEMFMEASDHIFFSGLALQKVSVLGNTLPPLTEEQLLGYRALVADPQANGATQPNGGPQAQDLFMRMLPSKAVPSDHFPVLAEFTVGEPGAAAKVKTERGAAGDGARPGRLPAAAALLAVGLALSGAAGGR